MISLIENFTYVDFHVFSCLLGRLTNIMRVKDFEHLVLVGCPEANDTGRRSVFHTELDENAHFLNDLELLPAALFQSEMASVT